MLMFHSQRMIDKFDTLSKSKHQIIQFYVVMGSGQKCLTRVRSAIYGLELENFP